MLYFGYFNKLMKFQQHGGLGAAFNEKKKTGYVESLEKNTFRRCVWLKENFTKIINRSVV